MPRLAVVAIVAAVATVVASLIVAWAWRDWAQLEIGAPANASVAAGSDPTVAWLAAAAVASENIADDVEQIAVVEIASDSGWGCRWIGGKARARGIESCSSMTGEPSRKQLMTESTKGSDDWFQRGSMA